MQVPAIILSVLAVPWLAQGSRFAGSVIESDSTQKVNGAQVLVFGLDRELVGQAFTDASGSFQIDGLGRAPFQIEVSAQNHLSTVVSLSSRPDNEAGGSRANLILRLVRYGTISGRVSNDLGRSVPAARVTVFRKVGTTREYTWEPLAKMAETDDGGRFRLVGFLPGTYQLCANDAIAKGLVVYSPTFTFVAGETYDGIEIQSPSNEGYRIDGHLQDASGLGGMIVLVDARRPQAALALRLADQGSGHFTFENVRNGKYHLLASANGGGAQRKFGSIAITVADASVDGIDLPVIPSKRLEIEVRYNSDADATVCKTSLVVDATTTEAVGAIPNAEVKWRGQRESLPSTLGPFAPWLYNVSIHTLNGECRNRSPITVDLSGPEVISHLAVTLASLGGISGHVDKPGGYWVVLIPLGAHQGKSIWISEPNDTGDFQFSKLDTGSYYVLARKSGSDYENWVYNPLRDPPAVEVTSGDMQRLELNQHSDR